uniref:Uncharacterized protein n=1 Tax=Timema genevievae TaxID=629358 RepID=A0A7R9PQC9_TIMGE|nr:unnamed protein product [Timema genevievae]
MLYGLVLVGVYLVWSAPSSNMESLGRSLCADRQSQGRIHYSMCVGDVSEEGSSEDPDLLVSVQEKDLQRSRTVAVWRRDDAQKPEITESSRQEEPEIAEHSRAKRCSARHRKILLGSALTDTRPDKTLAESEDTVASPFEDGDTVASPFEDGDTVASPFEGGDTVASPFEDGDTLASPFEDGDTVASPFEDGDTVASPYEDGEKVASPYEDGDTVASPYEDGDTGASPYEDGDTGASPYEDGDTGASPYEDGEKVASALIVSPFLESIKDQPGASMKEDATG